MSASRRNFLTYSSLAVLGAALDAALDAQAPPQNQQQATPGAPTAFGTSPAVGPEVSPATFAEAEKLVQFQMTTGEREQAASNWRVQMAPNYELRVGPRRLELEASLQPATLWNPAISQAGSLHHGDGSFVRSESAGKPLPA